MYTGYGASCLNNFSSPSSGSYLNTFSSPYVGVPADPLGGNCLTGTIPMHYTVSMNLPNEVNGLVAEFPVWKDKVQKLEAKIQELEEVCQAMAQKCEEMNIAFVGLPYVDKAYAETKIDFEQKQVDGKHVQGSGPGAQGEGVRDIRELVPGTEQEEEPLPALQEKDLHQ